jgi:carbonic anhydrase/acetyltransferase-like protein (isoleucine patch superfamily)
MILEHLGRKPAISPGARIAPNAVICGDITIGENGSIGFGAVLTAESGSISIGPNCVIMDAGVLRGVRANSLRRGRNVLVGPHAYLTGCTVEDNVFIATGATVFNGAVLKRWTEIRVNGIVHIRTVLPEGSIVPLGRIAVGDPAEILPPERHEEIWTIQRELNFPKTVWGMERPADGSSLMPAVLPRYAGALRHWHNGDRSIP